MRFSNRISTLTMLLEWCVFEIVLFVSVIGAVWLFIAVVTEMWRRARRRLAPLGRRNQAGRDGGSQWQ